MRMATVRPATPEDIASIYELTCEMEQTRLDIASFEDVYLELLDEPSHLFLVAERTGEQPGGSVGFIHLRIEPQLHHVGLIAEVMELAVADGTRSQGIGSKLLAHAEDLARERGCLQIEVACNQLRTRAHAFYERDGMHNFHYKFSKPLAGEDAGENRLGR